MTHGLCGKEGAMVFKRVLKGIGRLMLTTAVMCGVGLFLCSSEVKAATVGVTSNDGNLNITVTDDSSENISSINSVSLYKDNSDTDPIFKVDEITSEIDGSSLKFTITKENFLKHVNKNAITDGSSITIKKIDVSYTCGNNTQVNKSESITVETNPIYKLEMSYSQIDPSATFGIDSFSYKNINVGADIPYGYAGDTIEVTANPTGQYMLKNYYRYHYVSSSPGETKDWKWSEADSTMSIKLSNTASNDYIVKYLPKIKELKITEPTTGKVEAKVANSTEQGPTQDPIVTCAINSWEQTGEDCDKDVEAYIFAYKSAEIDNNTLEILGATSNGNVRGSFVVNCKLKTAGEKGSGKVTLKATLPVVDGTMFPEPEISVPVYLSVPADGFTLNSTTVSLMAGVEQQFDIIKAITPAGADQTISNYTFQVTESPNSTLLESISYAAGKVTLKAKSNVTSGTATVKINLMDGSNVLASQTLNVKIISFDKEKTISSINKNNKNYITYNKDKGYSLDIKQLIIDNAKDTSDSTVTITKDQIIAVSVDGSSCTDGIWKPSEAALNQKVSCKINGVQISESDGLKVSAYPMPTATYSSSNRTLSVKIPTKVATAYSDDNNIRQSKGFKLILEDSSGNTLYEYTDSKYQNVLSSSSESTVTYTVTAADIEGMITSAASNGKFSADTTSVKFKVIPMGYKQSSTSDETIKAKDEIAGKTDAVTVYKVSASGTNFTSSAAYGLDGQTVSITATPNSGYSFKQWSDGNTSNPRQVKVSASGTRSFQAVAGDRVANSTGAGGTDNSELYDDVPKTAESNSAIWLIVFMVFAVMGTTYALYLQLRAANSKHDR